LQPKVQKMLEMALPTKADYRKMPYRPTTQDATAIFTELNEMVFGSILDIPPIILKRLRKSWGWCYGETELRHGKQWPITIEIQLYPYYPSAHVFVAILAHEMVHHWQWSVYSVERVALGKEPLMSHGPSFYKWRSALEKHKILLSRNF